MKLQPIATWLQLDSSLSMALVARGWQAISGPITLMLLVLVLSRHEQGVFTTILSVVAIQTLFELGLGSVLIGQAGNMVGRAKYDSNSETVSQEKDNSIGGGQLLELASVSLKWFSFIAVLYAIGGCTMGWKTLSSSGIDLIDWRMPLALTISIAAVTLAIAPRVYVLEGGGEREYVYRMRLWQAVFGSLIMWLSLLMGLKLWSIVAVFAVGAVFQLTMAFGTRAQRLLGDASNGSSSRSHVSWLAHLAPVQWRAAAASAAHFLASQLLLIYITNYYGASTGAPLGLTLQITVAVQSLSLAWAQTKFPLISRYQAEGERETAGNLWRQTTLVSSGLLVLAMVGLAIAIAGLPLINRAWGNRFIPPVLVIVLGVGYLANHLFALQSYYVLSRAAKPLVTTSVAGLLFTAVAVWLGAKLYGVSGAVIAYSFSMACVTLPLHTWAYIKFRQGNR